MSTPAYTNDAAPPLHPLNHGFSWTPVRGPFRLITDEQARSFNERGFFVLENAIDPAAIVRVRDAIDPSRRRPRNSCARVPTAGWASQRPTE